jgi:DNA-binding NtrC family response regulator
MITGHPNLDSAEDALRFGAFDYIRKPVTFENLLRISKRALEHKKKGDARERQLSTREAILRNVTDAIVAVDADFRVLDINESSRRLCGLSGHTAGDHFGSLVKSCDGKCMAFLKKAVIGKKSGETRRIECNFKGRPGQTVMLTVYPLMYSKDTPGGSVMIIRDDTRPAAPARAEGERQQFFHIVGKSPEMQKIYSMIEALADVPTTVLITGESGTGKELVASALHFGGKRTDKPLVKVNCAALSENLLESELFGHVKGAFTGAIRDKIGRFQRADGGTIFLDEIGDVSANMQMRLLRVLQEKEFEMVGDSSPIRVDARVIVATNSNLGEKVRRGVFREDLYYRLKVVELSLPPLRDRKKDMPLLLDHFIKKFNTKFNKDILSVTDDVMNIFMDYHWPGNVRELEHKLEHAFVHCRKALITVDDLPPDFRGCRHVGESSAGYEGVAPGDERSAIIEALEKSFWNKTKAAALLGMSRRTIYRKIKDYHINHCLS